MIKYFGGNNVLIGKEAIEKGAKDWFQNLKVEFIENTVENAEFVGEIAIQTTIFSIKKTPKKGGTPSIARGRSLVIYVQDKNAKVGRNSLITTTKYNLSRYNKYDSFPWMPIIYYRLSDKNGWNRIIT